MQHVKQTNMYHIVSHVVVFPFFPWSSVKWNSVDNARVRTISWPSARVANELRCSCPGMAWLAWLAWLFLCQFYWSKIIMTWHDMTYDPKNYQDMIWIDMIILWELWEDIMIRYLSILITYQTFWCRTQRLQAMPLLDFHLGRPKLPPTKTRR